MKKLILVALLLIPTLVFATPSTIVFKPYSAAGITNYETTCSVLSGKVTEGSTAIDVTAVVKYDMSKGTGTSFTAGSNLDYFIKCFQTASPKDALTVLIKFGIDTTNYFPVSSIVLRRAP